MSSTKTKGLCFVALLIILSSSLIYAQDCPITITSIDGAPISANPPNIESDAAVIRYSLANPNLHSFLIVHPLTENQWWVQSPAMPIAIGQYQGIAILGDNTEGEGQYFEIIAVAHAASVLNAGDRLTDLPENFIFSNTVVVSRGRPNFGILNLENLPDGIPTVKMYSIINGRINITLPHVYVAVQAVGSNSWWIQRMPKPTPCDQMWQNVAQFGEPKNGNNQLFNIAVIQSAQPNLYRAGKEVSSFSISPTRFLTVRRID